MSGSGPSRSMVVLGPLSRRINRFVLRIAGRRRSGPVATVHHRGRRSGREYLAPVVARPIEGEILIPLFFGADADWCRNVLAAGQCRIDWRGTDHHAHRPRVADAESVRAGVRAGFPLPERVFFRVAGIHQYLVLDLAPAGTPG